MNRTTLPICEIIVENRQRENLGDLNDLANSIKRFGLIQPIVINQEKRLLAGGRRLAACGILGLLHIDVVYKDTLTEEDQYEIELEENVRRLEMSWQEKCKNIATIHKIRARKNALAGTSWGQRETSELFGINLRTINYSLRLATLLESGDKEICDAPSAFEAWQVVMRREEEKAMMLLARQSQKAIGIAQDAGLLASFLGEAEATLLQNQDASNSPSSPEADPATQLIIDIRNRARGIGYLGLSKEEAETLYRTNDLNDPDKFEWYYNQRREFLLNKDRTIVLSDKLLHIDSIEYMLRPDNHERFDFIVTDPPYGIEMDNLSQSNTGMVEIGSVEAEHDVKKNVDLFATLFPAAYHCLKPNTFFLLCCDIMQWNVLYDLAVAANFGVQRWPLTWCKTHACLNQMANVNFTKSTEIIMVCRKGKALLTSPQPRSHILASNDSLREKLGHPFCKPFELWKFLLEAVSLPNHLGLEPFAGRGSMVISALQLQRNIVACEKDSAHYNALLENIKQFYLETNPEYLFI